MRATVQRVLVAAAMCASAAASSLRVALFVGNGTDAGSVGNYTVALQHLVADGSISSYALLQNADVASLSPAHFDVVMFPGGSGSEESAAIGAAGGAAVQRFIAAGSGYVGTCAGFFLAGLQSCCAQEMPGYCGDLTGCNNASWALGLVDMGAAEPWNRGHGEVTITFTAEAVQMLQLPTSYLDKNISILYWQGPVQSRLHSWDGFTTLATFTSEIHSNLPQWTTGQQINTPAIITTEYGAGKGRVLLSSPHPEATVPMLLDLIRGYVLYAGRAI